MHVIEIRSLAQFRLISLSLVCRNLNKKPPSEFCTPFAPFAIPFSPTSLAFYLPFGSFIVFLASISHLIRENTLRRAIYDSASHDTIFFYFYARLLLFAGFARVPVFAGEMKIKSNKISGTFAQSGSSRSKQRSM